MNSISSNIKIRAPFVKAIISHIALNTVLVVVAIVRVVIIMFRQSRAIIC